MAERTHIPNSPACGQWETLLADALDGLLKPEDEATFSALVARHGSETPAVLALAADRPELLEPLIAGLPHLRVEAVWAARHEMAMTVDDVLSRRTRATLRQAEAAATGGGGSEGPASGPDGSGSLGIGSLRGSER